MSKFENFNRSVSREMDVNTMPEVSEAIKITFINRRDPILLACGDDRGFTPESAETLKKNDMPIDSAYLRLFGGKYGAARTLLVASTAQYGRKTAEELVRPGFLAYCDEVAQRAKEHGLVMISHSSEGAEGNPANLDTNAHTHIGCAYGAGIGAVSHLNAANPLSINTAKHESNTLFGRPPQFVNFDDLAVANKEASQAAFGDDYERFKITRQDLVATNTPVMVLKGDHAATEAAVHVLNMTTDQVSDANEAVARGLHYYDNDIVQVAEVLMKSFSELRLDPEILLNTMILDAAATRTALASGDGPADPTRIATQRLGSGQEALNYLSAL